MGTKKANYIDDGVVLSGRYDGKTFFPSPGLPCGFSEQDIEPEDIGTTLFTDIEKLNEYTAANNMNVRFAE